MNLRRALVLSFLVFLLAACGGGLTASEAVDGSEETPTPVASAAESTDDGNGDGDGSGSAGDNLEDLAEQLVPPNSTQTGRFESEGGLLVTYTSTDDPDSLLDFYEDAVADAGLQVVGTSSVEGGHSIIFSQDGNASFGGAVAMAPSDDGQTVVTVTLGETPG